MVKRFGRKLNLLLAVLAVLLVGYMSVSAAPSGTIQVIIRDSTDQPVRDINVELLQVAEYTNGSYVLTDDFAKLGIDPQQLLNSLDAVHAEQAFQYAYGQALSGVICPTDKNGAVNFTGLREGIYLACEYGGQVVAFQPFLVTIPAQIDGEESYFVVSRPKTSDTDIRTVVCVKLWEDELDAAGKRPDSIKVTLLRDNVPYRTATLSETTGWQYKFHMLPVGGIYTVKEDPVYSYSPEYLPAIEGYIVVNTFVPGAPGGGGGGGSGGGEDDGEDPKPNPAHVSVSKVWDDNNNANGKRPDSVTVQLILDDTVIATTTLSASNYWKHTFMGLDATKSYTVKEIAVPEYSAAYRGTAASGVTITNTFSGTTDPGTPPPPVVPEPELIDIPVRVEWLDENDAAGKRPGQVTVSLIANGSVVSMLQLDASTGWEGVFSGVPADLYYAVWQNAVNDYTTTYGGDPVNGFVVTNAYTEGTTDPGVPEPPADIPVPEEPPADTPEVPTQPETPPAEPTIPQTGTEVLPVYLLMAAGILLVFFGLVDLYRGRKCYEEEN